MYKKTISKVKINSGDTKHTTRTETGIETENEDKTNKATPQQNYNFRL